MADTIPTINPAEAFKTPEQKKSPNDPDEVVAVLEGYRFEATENRKQGDNPRDEKWDQNLDLYWNRFDFSEKASWQAKEVMPEVPTFVDRFAAALKEALIANPDGFYDIDDPTDKDDDLAPAIKRMTDTWLTQCGRNQQGHVLSFAPVFEEQVKLGSLMAMCSTVTWRHDTPKGRVSIESVDPRKVWLDPTFRNLYRVRRIEIDRHELHDLIKMTDNKGKPLFNLEQINGLITHVAQEQEAEKEKLSGHGQKTIAKRNPVVLDEYIATVVAPDGTVIAKDAVCVVANEKFLIRGPEANPFWHGKDWMVYTPLVTAPLSVYGRTYMEDFGSVAKTFNELTNLIIDAVQTSSLKAFAIAPSLLANPQQAAEGIHPNKIFILEDGVRPDDFWKAIDLGNLPPESVSVWTAMKNELREAAGINEIGLGQLAPNSRTSATEIASAQESSSALIRSIAQTVETRWLDPTLDMVWKTGVRHVKKDDEALRRAAGPELFDALIGNRRELASRAVTFQARGISSLIQKSRLLRSVMNILQIVGSNELLLKEFLQVADMQKLVLLLLELSDIDVRRLRASDREAAVRSIVEPAQQRAQQAAGQAGPNLQNEAQQLAEIAGALGGAGA